MKRQRPWSTRERVSARAARAGCDKRQDHAAISNWHRQCFSCASNPAGLIFHDRHAQPVVTNPTSFDLSSSGDVFKARRLVGRSRQIDVTRSVGFKKPSAAFSDGFGTVVTRDLRAHVLEHMFISDQITSRL
jgi:hypothetical protein